MKKILVSALMATAVFSAQAEDEIAESVKASFSGVYFGGGFHFMSYQDYADYVFGDGKLSDMENSTKSRLGGTVVLGIGKKFESIPFYLALEAGLDFAPNADLYSKDKSDVGGTYYVKDAAWAGAEGGAITLDDLGVAPVVGATPPAGIAAGTVLRETSGQLQYSVKIRRNGLNPSLGLRIAWASDLLKSLAYIKIGGYYTKDKLRYKEFTYFASLDRKHTVALDGGGKFAVGAFADEVTEIRTKKIDTPAIEVFNSKVCPELTVGIEKRAGNIGMRLEGGYIFNSSTKEVKADEYGGNLHFKKKGSCVVRLLGVWNLNLFK